ncbi:MAG: hypothetical protein ACFFFB_04680 [Candidatus Heimdallarchaeota archaeon]
MSSKAVSYYDWTLNFKKNAPNHKSSSHVNEVNTIGMKDDEFKSYIRKWKKRNL